MLARMNYSLTRLDSLDFVDPAVLFGVLLSFTIGADVGHGVLVSSGVSLVLFEGRVILARRNPFAGRLNPGWQFLLHSLECVGCHTVLIRMQIPAVGRD
jgi:hypothetical protein